MAARANTSSMHTIQILEGSWSTGNLFFIIGYLLTGADGVDLGAGGKKKKKQKKVLFSSGFAFHSSH